MRFVRDNWYKIMLVAFVATAFFAIATGWPQTQIQTVLLLSLMTLPIHQYEEYAIPGGGPVVINRYFYGEKENYRRFPGNWNSVMIVNLSAYVFYILALVFPDVIWLGLATMLFNLYQVLGHCFQMNIKMGTWYNPGMASTVLLFLPLSIWYIVLVVTGGLTTGMTWLYAVLAFAGIAVLTVIVPVQGLKRADSPYEIPQWQVDQLERVRAAASVHRGK